MRNELDFTPRPLVAGSTSAPANGLRPHHAEEFVSKSIKKELVLLAGSKRLRWEVELILKYFPHGFSINSCLLYSASLKEWLLFQDPIRVYQAHHQEEVIPFLKEVEQRVLQKGFYSAGFISFEASPAFDPALPAKKTKDFPLLWLGVYPAGPTHFKTPYEETGYLMSLRPSVSKSSYQRSVKKIQKYIQSGDIYQANHTFHLRGKLKACTSKMDAGTHEATGHGIGEGSQHHFPPAGLMESFCVYPYSAMIFTKDWNIYSASPELFFQKEKAHVVSKPMKGTHRRGLWFDQDQRFAHELRTSEKQRAENLMIVDMVRNDLGKIAGWGTVKVDHLFQLERYPHQWQMTSQVSCLTRAGVTDIFQAMFPAASITGAPKKRAMEIIQMTEERPRRVYTGSIGFITPHGQAQFNVAIRTLLVDKKRQTAEYGTGSGIVWDSQNEEEWEECLNKTRVIVKNRPSFSLLETLLWEPQKGFFLLKAHLRRLLNSARYFLMTASSRDILEALQSAMKNVNTPSKVRLRLSMRGGVQITHTPLSHLRPIHTVVLAKEGVHSENPLLYHKTTQRSVYEKAIAGAGEGDEVILWNEREEVTEATRANLAVSIDGVLFTPPVSCGLLPGTYRSHLIKKGHLRERVITKKELWEHRDEIYLFNSVRKQWKVKLSRR